VLAASIIRAIWNVGKLLPDYKAQQPRRQSSSYSPPREPEISPRNSLYFMEREVSLKRLQEPNTGPYPEPAKSSPQTQTHSFKLNFNVDLPSTPGSTKWLLPFRCADRCFYECFISPCVLSCPSYHSWCDDSNNMWLSVHIMNAPHYKSFSTLLLHD
jgi:hypothetical protein